MQDSVRQELIGMLPRVRRFAHALTGDPDRADDLLQDTVERALSRLDQFQPGTRLDSWMFKIAQNLWFNRRSALALRGPVVDLEEAAEIAGSDGREITEARLTLAAVNAGIETLPDNQKVLIALVCVEGLSYREAADVLELPIGTVMSRLSRARQTLFALLEPTLAGPASLAAAQPGGRHA